MIYVVNYLESIHECEPFLNLRDIKKIKPTIHFISWKCNTKLICDIIEIFLQVSKTKMPSCVVL